MPKYRQPPFFPISDTPTLGEQIRDMVDARNALDSYEASLKMKWEAGQKKEEKPNKKNTASFYIMLGVLSVPVMMLWNLTIVGGFIMMFKLLKNLN